MKKTIRFGALLLALALLVGALVGCGQHGDRLPEKASMTIVLTTEPATEIQVELDGLAEGATLVDVLDKLVGEGKLTYEAQDGAYGKFITGIGDLKPGATNEFISIYTDNSADADVSQYATTYTYGDKTLTSSGFGVSDMHLKDGTTVLFTIGSY